MPSVGIFFKVNNQILMDAVDVEAAEAYGDACGYGGHYSYWSQLSPDSLQEYYFKNNPYDCFPRGRVVYFHRKDKYVVYGDRCLTRKQLAEISLLFGVPVEKVIFARDCHYQCAVCNRSFVGW